MRKEVAKIDVEFLSKQVSKEAIGDDFIMVDDITEVPLFEYPVKIDYAVLSICLKGRIEGGVDLKPFSLSANELFILMPGQIVQYSYKSEDHLGISFAISKRFADNLELNIRESLPAMLHLKENPIMHLSPDEISYLQDYYDLLLRTVRKKDIPNQLEMIRLMIQALFYNIQSLQKINIPHKSKREGLFEDFYRLLLVHYKESREVGFYADKLCLTPKYLSTVIRKLTGRSAFGWINDYVTLEAKALLKSTNMTVQQISDKLNFPSQSFFGKYFKRMTGMSPKEYRDR